MALDLPGGHGNYYGVPILVGITATVVGGLLLAFILG